MHEHVTETETTWILHYAGQTAERYSAVPGSTQPCIPPGSLNRVPALAGVKAGMSPLSGVR